MSFIRVYNSIYKDIYIASFINVFNFMIQSCLKELITACILIIGQIHIKFHLCH